MEAKLMRRIQRSGWDRAASCYEDRWGIQLQPSVDALLRAAALRPGEHVLDVACGTGLATLPAARAVGPGGRVLATDLSPRMVAVLEDRVAAADLGNVAVEVIGAEAIEHDAAFDAGLCSLGLMYVPDPHAALAAIHRAVRPGGRVAVSVWGERRHCGWAPIFPIVDARVSSDVCPMFFALGGPDALRHALERAGFTGVDHERVRVELFYDSAEAALGAAFDGGPVALAASRFDASTRASAHADYLAAIAPHADGRGYRIPGEFVIASGRRP